MKKSINFDKLEQMARLSAAMTVHLQICEMIIGGASLKTIESHCETMLHALDEQVKVLSEAEVCQIKQNEYERGIEDGKIIAEHGTVNWQT